ncbi:MAG: MraY family glycosyltransferase [Actinomycetota bacterium]
MRPVLTSYLAVAALAAAVTLCLVPLVRLLAVSTNLLAKPDDRMFHDRPTPFLGGVAMYVGFVVAFFAAWLSGRFDAIFSSSTEPFGVLAGATIAWLVGLIDDIKDISAPAKTAGLSLAGVLLVIGGVSIIWFRIPFLDVFVLPYDLALLFSVVWVLGMANAVNFIDGLDGLAAGIVGIGAAAFLLYGFRLGQVELILAGNIGPLVAALVLGVCLGFLPWNVYPARIFMGDSGSLLLGTLMAASTMAVGGRTPDPFSGQTFFFYAPLAIPLFILGVPILDTAFAIVRRATHRQGLATADKDHLHHRLVRLGHGHRRSVGILWSWTALLSAFVLYPTYNEGRGDGIVPMGVGALALLLYTLFHPGIKAETVEAGSRRTRLANLKAATDLAAVARIRAARANQDQLVGAGGSNHQEYLHPMTDLPSATDQPATSRQSSESIPDRPISTRSTDLNGTDLNGRAPTEDAGQPVLSSERNSTNLNGTDLNGTALNGTVLNGAERTGDGDEDAGAPVPAIVRPPRRRPIPAAASETD